MKQVTVKLKGLKYNNISGDYTFNEILYSLNPNSTPRARAAKIESDNPPNPNLTPILNKNYKWMSKLTNYWIFYGNLLLIFFFFLLFFWTSPGTPWWKSVLERYQSLLIPERPFLVLVSTKFIFVSYVWTASYKRESVAIIR